MSIEQQTQARNIAYIFGLLGLVGVLVLSAYHQWWAAATLLTCTIIFKNTTNLD
jgi:hypothetical protein